MEFLQKRLFSFLLIVACTLTVTGCRSKDKDFSPHVTRLYLEESSHLPPSHIAEMILPVSGSHITVRSKPIYGEWDIAQAGHFETEFGPAIILLFRSEAATDFYRTTISNQGRRLVVTINGLPLGAHYIDRPIEDGRISFFLEIPDEEVPEVARAIQKTSEQIRKESNKSKW